MLRELAGSIWRQHCAEIISAAQIDYNASAGGLNFTGDYLANSSFVTVTAVPEPSALVLMAIGAGLP